MTTKSTLTGQGVYLGTWTLDDSHRLVATKYSPGLYSKLFLDDKAVCTVPDTTSAESTSEGHDSANIKYRSHCKDTYHSSHDLSLRGTTEDRQRFLTDMQANAIDIPPDVASKIMEWVIGQENLSSIPGSEYQQVALGLKYDKANLRNDDRNSAFHYCRLYYYAGARSDFIATGRIKLNDLQAESTIECPIIDEAMRSNFGQTVGCTRESQSLEYKPGDIPSQQAILSLGILGISGNADALPINWSLPYNDTFFLGGIHYQTPVLLASKRSEENMVRADKSDGLTVTGREVAIIMGSGAYSLHSTSWGEALVPRRAGKKYGIKELSEVVKRYILEPNYQKSLTWLSDLTPTLQPGEVVVTDSESLIDGQWVKSWEASDTYSSPE